jgi:hypothetical protein
MKGTRWYGFGAGVADVYILAIALGTLPALYVALSRRPLPPWEPFVALAALLVGIVLAGAGRARAGGLVVAYLSLGALPLLVGRRPASPGAEAKEFLAWWAAGSAAATALVLAYYDRHPAPGVASDTEPGAPGRTPPPKR